MTTSPPPPSWSMAVAAIGSWGLGGKTGKRGRVSVVFLTRLGGPPDDTVLLVNGLECNGLLAPKLQIRPIILLFLF